MNAMKRLFAIGLAGMMAWGTVLGATVCSGTSAPVEVLTGRSKDVNGRTDVWLSPFARVAGEEATVMLDGELLFTSSSDATVGWYPRTAGAHVLISQLAGHAVATQAVTVKTVEFGPNPPTSPDPDIAISPLMGEFKTSGGWDVIATSGSGTWEASTSESWLVVDAASGEVGVPVGYTVEATTNEEERTGYVYVSGHVYTVRQAGLTVLNPDIVITPPTRNFGVGGGGGAIVVTGSGTWEASVSDDWITLNAVSGDAGYPVAYTVSATTNVEGRTGYVYVSGHVHTVTQDGVGGSIEPEGETYEWEGGTGTIAVTAPAKIGWQARANTDWLGVGQSSGTGPGTLEYTVAPFDEVSTRQGTLTVAGNTFTVFQYGRRMKISPVSATYDYYTHVIPITVNALAITEWEVEPRSSWISVVDGGTGKGSDLVTVAIGENPSWAARTGTVRIGTETFTVRQTGRTAPALEFAINPAATTASVEGANGLVSVLATPDLPWKAESGASWLTLYGDFAEGAGNGNVVYSASPNPTLFERTGDITVTPADTNVEALVHRVTQPAALSALSMNGYEFEAAGESCEVRVSLADIVQWEVVNTNGWLTVVGASNRVGPGTVVLQAEPNESVDRRSGTVTIARRTFKVSQKARGVEVEYETKLFGADGGSDSISIHPDGNVAWAAVASDPTWITVFQGGAGTGDGEVMYIVSPYVGTGEARTGTITVGDKVVWISQRAYDLSIDPAGAWVPGNAGAGEFGVSAGIGDVWTAIVTEPWLWCIEGYDEGTGSGIVRFMYTDNDTGKPRTGKIIVAGEVYTLQQRAREFVEISADAGRGGTVAGAGTYDLGTTIELVAVPDSGYQFSYWTGEAESTQNPLPVLVDVPKSYTAVFEVLPIEFERVESTEEGVWLGWNNLAWATTYRVFRGTTSVPSAATVVAELPNTGECEWLDATGEMEVEYWYWIEAVGVEDDVMSDPMTGRKLKPIIISPIVYENLMGAENPNPETYREETAVTFEAPGAVEGYTFAGWTPPQITPDMTGTQVVTAAWTANGYLIAYNPNGGSGTMEPTVCTYDQEAEIAGNGFVRWGWRFAGWALESEGAVVYAGGEVVSNLTAQSGGVVTLFAAWNPLEVAAPVIDPPDGTVFLEEECVVSIGCATEGAAIYFSTNGATPKVADAYLYGEPFAIRGTTTVKALAVLEGVRSEYAAATITHRVLPLAEAAGAAGLEFATGGDGAWRSIVDRSARSGFAVASGAIGTLEESWMEATVEGEGTLQFDWKVDCEQDESGDATWDHLSVSVDGAEAGRIDGATGWMTVRLAVVGEGTHTVRWTYAKDAEDAEGAEWLDGGWVTGVIWAPKQVAEAVYDGEEHGLDAAELAAAFGAAMEGEGVVEFALSDEGGAETPPAEGWSAEAPVFTNACEEAVWYRVVNPNYAEFADTATVRVAPRPVQVLVAGRIGTFVYDGTEKAVEGWSAAAGDALYDVETMMRFAGAAAEARRTDAGKTAMGLSEDDFGNTDANFAVEFFVDDGWVEVAPADISEDEDFEMALGANPTYDGMEQSVAVESVTWDGMAVTFEVSGNAAVHAGAYTLTVEGTGNFTGTRTAEWRIEPRTVTLESASAEKVYDGTPLTAEGVAVAEGSMGFVEGDGFTAVCTGSLTDVGLDENAFEWAVAEGTLASDYRVLEAYGLLRVTAADISEGDAFEVALEAAPVYDGTEQTVGVESVTWNGLPVTFEVAGNSGIHAGAYTMIVAGSGNFAGERTAGWAIEPRAVTLVSGGATKVYDGKALTNDDVAVAEGTPGFVEGEGFSAVCTGSQTEVGTNDNVFEYELDGALESDYIVSTVFGTLEVTPADISEDEDFEVVLGANPTYDGTEQSVSVESVTWDGMAVTFEVAGNAAVHAGAYTLTVEGTGNFTGTRTAEWRIEPRAVTLESASAEKLYDGTPLTADGVRVTEGALDFVEGEGFTAVCTGSQTEVGTSENTFAWTPAEGTLASDYAITKVYGTLTVTEAIPDDPIPAVSDDSEVAAALEGSADPRLAVRLTTAAAYNEYRDWVTEKGLDRQAVKDSPHAWPSFLLGSETLFENEPTIQIAGIGFGSGETVAMEIRLTIKDGETTAPVDAAKVAALFAATGEPGDWKAAPLPVEALQSGREGDTLLFQVTPGTGTEPAGFLRLSE